MWDEWYLFKLIYYYLPFEIKAFSIITHLFPTLKLKVYVHHFTEYIDQQIFEDAKENCQDMIQLYDEMENAKQPKKIPKLKPIIWSCRCFIRVIESLLIELFFKKKISYLVEVFGLFKFCIIYILNNLY